MMAWTSSSKIDTTKFMAEPVTDIEILQKNMKDMKTKMELLILKIQVILIYYIYLLFYSDAAFFVNIIIVL